MRTGTYAFDITTAIHGSTELTSLYEKCTRRYIFHHNITSKSKEAVQKLFRNPL